MIQLESVYKSFGERTVLNDINYTFENGKTNLIIGQSGSGKTVLMKCIVGLLTPEQGKVLYDGRNLLDMGKKEKKTLRREMGMIFQSAALFDSLTVLENVMFPLDMFSNDTYRDRIKRAQFCLDRVNLLDAQNKLLYSEIGSRPCSVAVHVRRGDLKVEIPAYGKPASLEYFKSAVAYMQDRDMSSFFYFFSDEPDWVRDELIPQLYLTEGNCKVVDINGSDKGYMDLFLIACCRHQITSKGTLGKYGALLEDNPEKTVVLCDDEVEYPWKELFLNPVFL